MSDHNPADNFPTDDDEFKQDPGIKDDYDGVITDAWFGTSQNQPGTLYFCKIEASDGEIVERRYTTGDDWSTYDGGVTVEHPTKKHFNMNTLYARLMTAIFACPGAEEVVRARSKELGGLGPRSAKLLVGLNFHWEAFPESGTMRDRDDPTKMREWSTVRIFPTAFNGVQGVSNPTAATQAPAPASATAGTTTSDQSDPLSTVDSSTAAQIKVLAASKTYPEFVDSVMGLTDMVSNDTIMAALGDESWYNSLKG